MVKRVRAERGNDKVLFLDGGDTWQGSLGANRSKGQDMVDCMALPKPDAMTGHWEFTYGAQRVQELVDSLGFPFLAQNVRDTEFEDPVFESTAYVEANRRAIRLSAAFVPLIRMAILFGFLCTFVVGGRLVLEGSLQAGF